MLRSFFPSAVFDAPADPAPAPAPTVPATVPTTVPTTAPANPWYHGKADAETVGHWQNRGWADKPADFVAIEATKAHREAEKLIGAPANEMVRLPKDPASPDWAKVWQRLGAPTDPKDYDFSAIKGAGDKPIDTALDGMLRAKAYELHLPKDAATAMARAFVKHLDDAAATDAATRAAAIATEKTELSKNWGPNADANRVIAQNAARALGVAPQTVAALESQLGYAKVMEMFRNIGTKIGEDKFIKGGPGAGPGIMTRDAALSRVQELKGDREWSTRYLNGGLAERQQMNDLMQIIAGGS